MKRTKPEKQPNVYYPNYLRPALEPPT